MWFLVIVKKIIFMSEIKFIEPHTNAEVKKILNPVVSEWFFGKFKDFSLTQLYGVKNIYDRKNILVSAPTGGTKTLTAFLGIINYLVDLALKNELEEKIYAVYTSPLKALSNDIYVNLVEPLNEIKELIEKKGLKMQEIRVGLRTGILRIVRGLRWLGRLHISLLRSRKVWPLF